MATSDSSRHRQIQHWEPIDPWSVPIFRIRRLRVSISYLSLLVAAVVVGATAQQAAAGMRQETIVAILIGCLFWLSGWVVQGLAYLMVGSLVGTPVRRLNFGVFGIKTPPRRWSVGGAVAVGLGILTGLILLGSGYGLINSVVADPNGLSYRQQLWSAPSIGLSEYDSPWLAGAWICWFQAMLQLLPVGQSIGRLLISSAIVLAWREREVSFQLRMVRRVLSAIAVTTVLAAIWLQSTGNSPRWPLLLGIGIAIGIGARSRDIVGMLREFSQHRREVAEAGIRKTARQLLQRRKLQQSAKRAMRLERGEAADEAQLDAILDRLGRQGAESLSREDRKLLQRVSRRVRRERDGDSSSG